MRVIAGRFRSRTLRTIAGLDVRPTPDRLRESLFSILMPRLGGTVFLDIYAGSGAVGIEALSRGAKRVLLIEKNRKAVEVIRENLRSLNIEEEVAVYPGSAGAVLPGVLEVHAPDIVFFDPPYTKPGEYDETLGYLDRAGSPFVIAQHTSRLVLPDQTGGLRKTRVVKQGDNSLTFYERGVSEPGAGEHP